MTLAYLVYIGLLVTLVIFWSLAARVSVGPNDLERAIRTERYVIAATVIAFTLLIGFRYDVGGDFFGYIDYYRFSTSRDASIDVGFEPGFLFLIQVLKFFELPERSIIIASSFIQILFLSIWLRKRSKISPFIIYMIFTTLLLFEVNNIIRQGIALFIILVSLDYINEKKLISFVACAFLACMFHRSALIILPLGIIFWRIRVAPVWIQVIALILAYSTVDVFLDQVISLFTFLSPLFGYTGYSDISRADLAFGMTDATLNIAMYFWPIVDVIVISYSNIMQSQYNRDGYRIYHNIYLVAALLQPVAMAWNFLPFARGLFYFIAMRTVCIGYLLHYCFKVSRSRREVIIGSGVAGAFFIWFVVAISRGAAWSAPYQF